MCDFTIEAIKTKFSSFLFEAVTKQTDESSNQEKSSWKNSDSSFNSEDNDLKEELKNEINLVLDK